MRWRRYTDSDFHAPVRVTFHPNPWDAAYALALAVEMAVDALDPEREAKALALVGRAGKATVQRACVDLYASNGRNSDNWSEISIEAEDDRGYADRLTDAAYARIRELWPELR